jgi:hypothetical protein
MPPKKADKKGAVETAVPIDVPDVASEIEKLFPQWNQATIDADIKASIGNILSKIIFSWMKSLSTLLSRYRLMVFPIYMSHVLVTNGLLLISPHITLTANKSDKGSDSEEPILQIRLITFDISSL